MDDDETLCAPNDLNTGIDATEVRATLLLMAEEIEETEKSNES